MSTDQPSRTPYPTVQDVVRAADTLWPFRLQESWDASGLVMGRPGAVVKRIHLAVDPVDVVVREAVGAGADMLLTHHPLLLRGVTSVSADGFKGRAVHDLVENRCSLLSCHTNADAARRGVSDALSAACGVNPDDAAPLVPHATDPAVGLGRVGTLERAVTLRELAERLAARIPQGVQGLRVAGDPERRVSTVAVCGGSGDSIFDEVREHGADVFVTADLRHHPASEARERAVGPGGHGTPALIDATHWGSEAPWLPWAAKDLQRLLAERGFHVETHVSGLRTDPWDFRVTAAPQDQD